MADVWVITDGVSAERKTFESSVEVCYAVLCEEPDEIEATDGVFALGRW